MSTTVGEAVEAAGPLASTKGITLETALPDGEVVSCDRERSLHVLGNLLAKAVLHAKLDVAKAKLHEIAETIDDKWDEVKHGADHVWSDVKASVEGAYDALRKPSKEG